MTRIHAVNGGARDERQGYPASVRVVEPTGFDVRQLRIDPTDFLEACRTDPSSLAEPHASGWRIDPAGLPRKVCIGDARYLVDMDQDGVLKYVSHAARALIERMEPGIHQFAPVAFVDDVGRTIADMHVLIACRRLDTVDRARTTGMALSPHVWTSLKVLARIKPDLVPAGADLNAPVRLVYSVAQAGDAHLWVDRHVPGTLFMSQALVTAFDAAGLTGLARVAVDCGE